MFFVVGCVAVVYAVDVVIVYDVVVVVVVVVVVSGVVVFGGEFAVVIVVVFVCYKLMVLLLMNEYKLTAGIMTITHVIVNLHTPTRIHEHFPTYCSIDT